MNKEINSSNIKNIVKNSNKLLLLEINEISQETLDYALKFPKRYPNISKLIKKAYRLETLASDRLEKRLLEPWQTWPTFHRGCLPSEHGISVLGQDIKTYRGKTIWEEVLDKNKSIGIFGSLQSWPPVYPGKKGFYIPSGLGINFSEQERVVDALFEIEKEIIGK